MDKLKTAQIAPYGSWPTPVKSDLIVGGTVKLSDVKVDGDDIYWLEVRPQEGGRGVIVRYRGGRTEDLTPPSMSARTRAHEYGGGTFLPFQGVVYFVNDADQRIYRQEGESEPRAITPPGKFRYADGVFDIHHWRMIWVTEDYSADGEEPLSSLTAIDPDGNLLPEMLICGKDFFASPRISPDGKRLAWLAWTHPNMPWDASELWTAHLGGDGFPAEVQKVAGDPGESVCQPEWSPEGTLYFVSDRSGFWNLYRQGQFETEPIFACQAEFARPHWNFGLSNYTFIKEGEMAVSCVEKGIWHMAIADCQTLTSSPVVLPYSEIGYVSAVNGRIVFRAGGPTEPLSIVVYDRKKAEHEVLRTSLSVDVDSAYFSRPQIIEFPSAGSRTAYAFYYPPHNPHAEGPLGQLPPLLVKSHGGPTSQADSALKLEIQYWTTRGFAVVDVNYAGSTGYGTAYRRLLDGNWGVADVEDCVAAARYLVSRGLADPERMAITGGSAGGYTTLCALTFKNAFKAGASYYGISNLESLATDTHKFESRYLDRLVGPYPKQIQLYKERSPINFTQKLSCPIIFFQGLEDKVVPPAQAETMVHALRERRLPVAYITFADEQHGFRRAENIKRALDAELYFYSRIFGFTPAGEVEPVEIENLP